MVLEEFSEESPDISPGPITKNKGIWRRLLVTMFAFIVVSGLSAYVAVAVDRRISGDDPEPLVLLSAQEGKHQAALELQQGAKEESKGGDRQLEFQPRELQFCSVVAVAYGYGPTKNKAAYTCGYALGLLGCSPTYCTIKVTKIKYYTSRRQWRVDCSCY
jgi:hypothetical protein